MKNMVFNIVNTTDNFIINSTPTIHLGVFKQNTSTDNVDFFTINSTLAEITDAATIRHLIKDIYEFNYETTSPTKYTISKTQNLQDDIYIAYEDYREDE